MVKVAILGVGARGGIVYSKFQYLNPELMKIVALCDINEERLNMYSKEFNVEAENCFLSDEDFFSKPKLADAVLICTQDGDHHKHVTTALKKGYHVLLEKPISPKLDECIEIANLAKEVNRFVVVCHVLRYTVFFRKIKEIIDSGIIGKLMALNQLENVAYWHYAHSFVRGPWRNSKEASPIILAKCCHDMDIIYWLIGKKPVRISSFGDLKHFKTENAPKGSTKYCTQGCDIVKTCPYSAYNIYIERYKKSSDEVKNSNWLFNVLTNNQPTLENLEYAVDNGQYGRCVYACDNDVVDYQSCNMEFEDNITANLTMTAFTQDCFREVKVMGSLGEIVANDLAGTIEINVFGKDKQVINIYDLTDDLSGHGGGDNKLMQEFLTMIETNEVVSNAITTIDNSIFSHIMAFAAEDSRVQNGAVKEINDYFK